MAIFKKSLLVICLLLALSSSALAQPSTQYAVEGYVLDKATLRPIRNAYVQILEVTDGGALISQVLTDANGFFQIARDENSSIVSASLHAICGHPSKAITADAQLYSTLNAGTVYQRNLYITFPKGVAGCRTQY